MLIATITNTSGFTLGPEAGTDPLLYNGTYPPTVGQNFGLPGPFAWATIAPSGNKTFGVSVADLEAFNEAPGFGGMRVKDVLQQMIQAGYITVTYATVTADRDTFGKAVNAQ